MSFYNGYVLYVIVTLVICIAVGREITDERLKEDSSNLISKEEVLQEKVKHSLVRRDTAVDQPNSHDDPKKLSPRSRDDVRTIKTKVKDKVNSTITSTKDKVKQKVKDKVQKKIEEKLDPTGEPAEVHLQPLRKTDDYNLVTSQDYNNENGICNLLLIIQLEYTRSLICIISNINV
ncbi:hypothetical protein Avbf_08434 [Armadillidium vulgare]|nr:hypothetical protein Avbf_08434 [Armadillidium vulgare]